MINRLYQFTALFFILFCGFEASAKGGLYHVDHKNEKKASLRAATIHNSPFSYEYNPNNVLEQIINVQQHRGAHTLHAFYYDPYFYNTGGKYSDFICGLGTSELSRFRKLILYPFHGFW
jgi:hypothetical protein